MEWGLGHASRCLPLLNYLINNCKADLVVAANGSQADLIRESFPAIKIVHPPSYTIRYHKNRAGTIARLAFSLPHLAQQIKAENQWLRDYALNNPPDAIISDNRYGFRHPSIPSYLITHQLAVKTPFGKAVDALVRKQVYRYIEQFTACWVPDFEKIDRSLAGELSHPAQLPAIPVHYIGPLTRIHAAEPGRSLPHLINSQLENGRNIQLLVILSGPEPQRSMLETKILEQWSKEPGKSLVLVRGLPEQVSGNQDHSHIQPELLLPNSWVINHLSSPDLSQAIANASIILTRSGYSSVMDLIPNHKNLWMIPTPGQTEQEYLANYLSKKGLIRTVNQNQLSLEEILSPNGHQQVPDR
ncbi:glycosyltransferase [Flavihumibacter sp. UBA7668]|uniref:glycosyltransferase n=1 Tax=Flavihumibacter sp. UBA7668 TaxID=1946542 RepID=UPI0025BBB475|nr:glycosyltransferase [Flavihumibacter sp. UBA7668]